MFFKQIHRNTTGLTNSARPPARKRAHAHVDAHTGLYPEYPYLTLRMHEHYFVRCAETPIVFTDLRDVCIHVCMDMHIDMYWKYAWRCAWTCA